MRLAPLPPPYYTNERKRKFKIKWLLILILLLIIAAAVFVFIKKKSNKTDEAKDINILKDASELKREQAVHEEIKIPTVEANNEKKEDKNDEVLPSAYLANTDNELLSKDFLNKTEISTIKLIRDEIYARHGFVFDDKETQKYFETKTWYVKNPNYTDELLNDMEVKNLEIISKFLNEEKDNNDEIDKEE